MESHNTPTSTNTNTSSSTAPLSSPTLLMEPQKNLVREIKLTQNKIALVDSVNYAHIISYGSWVAKRGRSNWYAIHQAGRIQVFMHHLVLTKPFDKLIDHIDGNGLNNLLSNLRLVTNQENIHNQKVSKVNSSGYKGVIALDTRWLARITVNMQRIRLGIFSSREEAALAYNDAAIKYFGKFAKLNTI